MLCCFVPDDHKLMWTCRVGDTYPNQMLQVQVRAYFYRWKPHISLEVAFLVFECNICSTPVILPMLINQPIQFPNIMSNCNSIS